VNDVLSKKTVVAYLKYYLCLTGQAEVKTMSRNWTRRPKEGEIVMLTLTPQSRLSETLSHVSVCPSVLPSLFTHRRPNDQPYS
jgi:hypothetical protein